MKKFFSFLLFMAAGVAMPAFLTSCKDEVVDQFENLYGYWINSDYSGAMEISKDNSDQCKILYCVYTSNGLKTRETIYREGSEYIVALDQEGIPVTVEVVSSSSDNLALKYVHSANSDTDLSSYTFSKVEAAEFYEYLEGKYSGNSGDNDDQDDDAKKLIGTWVGYNGTPGLDYTIKYTLTFYSSGKATEEYSSASYGSGSMSGTYKYSDGKITEWDMKEGSVLANEWREPSDDYPWTVTFISSKEMKIGYKSYSIKFTKQ